MPDTATAVQLDWEKLARKFAHPTAIAVLELLAIVEDARSPMQLSQALDVSLGQVSYHVRQLAGAGLNELVSTRPRRGAVEHFYRLTETARA